jgi:exosortase family protein XrtF
MSFLSSNRRVLSFFVKMLAIYGLWYVAYDLWLLPDGRLDAWTSTSVADIAQRALRLMGYDAVASGRIVTAPGIAGVEIANGCNGLSTIGLFVGFVLAYPGSTARRLLFLPVGMATIYVTNVLRIVAMMLVQMYWPVAFDPLHSFGLTTIFYCVVFALWVVWANYGQPAPAQGDASSPVAVTPSAA